MSNNKKTLEQNIINHTANSAFDLIMMFYDNEPLDGDAVDKFVNSFKIEFNKLNGNN